MTVLNNVLAKMNAHERDSHIRFAEEGHKYTILTDPDSNYTSVTTWNHTHFPKFDADAVITSMMKGKGWKEGHKYWGMTPEQIKKQWSDNGASVSGAGTDLHYEIECFMNNNSIPYPYTHKELGAVSNAGNGSLEWKYFIEFVNDMSHLKPYRTEWTIYHEGLKLAGSIDMVYENPDGTLAIYDWKRSKDISRINPYNRFASTYSISHMPDSNFWHYALQLNTYKAIIEAKYEKRVTDLFLVRLHPDAVEKSYELIKLPILATEIKTLFDELSSAI